MSIDPALGKLSRDLNLLTRRVEKLEKEIHKPEIQAGTREEAEMLTRVLIMARRVVDLELVLSESHQKKAMLNLALAVKDVEAYMQLQRQESS